MALAGAVVLVGPVQAAAETPRLTAVGTFESPISVTAPEGDTRRLHVVERAGRIRVVRDGAILSEPFLDISAQVDTAGEGGLLSMAFPPSYRRSGYFYAFLTPNDATPGAPPYAPIEVREYRRSSADPDRADPASGRAVLTVAHSSFTNHYGGQLQFGPDALLYVSTGDGGSGGDPDANAQNTASRLGKLLRLDPRPDGSADDGSAEYHAPRGNPFARGGGHPLVWSYGLRNPFRFSFDSRTGDLTIGDVGQGTVEEVDFLRAGPRGAGRGANFGWNRCEGLLAYPVTQPEVPCAFGSVAPVHSYRHVQGSCSITGGLVVRDRGLESLHGRYLYGDFCRGFVNSLRLDTPNATADTSIGVDAPLVVAFGEDACRRVYVVQLSGLVSRLEDSSPSGCSRTVIFPSLLG